MLHSELHSEPSFVKLAIVLTALLINIVCVVTIISSFKYTIIDIKLSDEVKAVKILLILKAIVIYKVVFYWVWRSKY